MRLQAYNSTMEDVTDAALWSMPYSCMGNLIACTQYRDQLLYLIVLTNKIPIVIGRLYIGS